MRHFVDKPPAAEPIAISEASGWLRLDADAAEADTADVGRLVTAAREYCERYCDRAFAAQTWAIEMDRLREIELPGGGVGEIQSFTYTDASGAVADVPANIYVLTRAGAIRLRRGERWPNQTVEPAGVTIVYAVGDEAVPQDVQQAMRLLIAHWYENRQAAGDKAMSEVPLGVEALLARHREMSL